MNNIDNDSQRGSASISRFTQSYYKQRFASGYPLVLNSNRTIVKTANVYKETRIHSCSDQKNTKFFQTRETPQSKAPRGITTNFPVKRAPPRFGWRGVAAGNPGKFPYQKIIIFSRIIFLPGLSQFRRAKNARLKNGLTFFPLFFADQIQCASRFKPSDLLRVERMIHFDLLRRTVLVV